MTYKYVFILYMIYCAVPHGFEIFFIAFGYNRASALKHRFSVTVNIWSCYIFTASNSHAISTFLALTAIIPAHEEIIISAVMKYEWCFNGINTSIFGCRVRCHVVRIQCISSCYCLRVPTFRHVHCTIKLYYLYTAPERDECEPRRITFIDSEVRVNGVPVVAVFTRRYDAAVVRPWLSVIQTVITE